MYLERESLLWDPCVAPSWSILRERAAAGGDGETLPWRGNAQRARRLVGRNTTRLHSAPNHEQDLVVSLFACLVMF